MFKVLVVDDEYFAREGMKKTISWENYGCILCAEAKDGKEGIEQAKKYKPDLIITDINMPEINGIDMSNEIKKFLPESKIIIITGYDEFEYAKAAIKLNAVDFILKPIDDKEFLEAVKRAVASIKKSRNDITINKEDMLKLCNIIKEEKQLFLTIKAFDKKNMEKQLKIIYFDIIQKNKSNSEIIKQISIDIVLKALDLLDEYNIYIENIEDKNLNEDKMGYMATNIEEAYTWVYENLLNILNIIKEVVLETRETSIEKAIKYINEHFCEDISLSNVAQNVYLSESYLSRKIKKVKGMTFTEYITKLRIEKAMEYLKNSDIKITEIASNLGYRDYRYFSQIFKNYTGYSPSEFIKNKYKKYY